MFRPEQELYDTFVSIAYPSLHGMIDIRINFELWTGARAWILARLRSRRMANLLKERVENLVSGKEESGKLLDLAKLCDSCERYEDMALVIPAS